MPNVDLYRTLPLASFVVRSSVTNKYKSKVHYKFEPPDLCICPKYMKFEKGSANFMNDQNIPFFYYY